MSRAKSTSQLDISGTARKDRHGNQSAAETAEIKSIAGDAVMPNWLKGRAKKLWAEKTGIYVKRGQAVKGMESALAQYCRLEAQLIEKFWNVSETPPASLFNVFVALSDRFYDNPKSQLEPSGGDTQSNPFANNKRGGKK